MSVEDRRTWAYGSAGEAIEFACPEDVPHGWRDHPWRAAAEAPAVTEDSEGCGATQVPAAAIAGEPEGDAPAEPPRRRGRPPKVR